VTDNDWRIKRLQEALEKGTATDEQKAMLELLLEGTGQKAFTLASSTEQNEAKVIGAVDKENESDEDRPPDYDQVNMDDFGAAFLRGRGWKKGEGIGRTNKRVVPLVVHAKGKTFDLGIKKKKPNGG
jgi:hypothetical protein